MSQSNHKEPTSSADKKSVSHSSEMKLKDSKKTDLQKPKLSALPQEDPRLRNYVQLSPLSNYDMFLWRVKNFFSRLFRG